MNVAALTSQRKTPPLAALQGPVANEISESIMTGKQLIWQAAHRQAKQVGKLKNQKAKSRQVVLLCETLKRALEGGRHV